MKLPIIGPLLNTATLLLLLGSFIASLRNTQAVGFRTRSVDGYLLVYSATDEVSDGDLVFNAHSSYLIYTTDGKLFKSVENHMSRSDEIPGRVSLPAGSYIVEARSASSAEACRACSIIRPTGPGQLDATGVINSFIADGLFRGQPPQFLQLITSLASAADAAEREVGD